LWSMSDNIYFDNIIITDSLVDAHELSEQTFQLKAKRRANKEAGVIERILKYSNDRPWMYAVYIIAIGLPLVMVVFFCCFQSSKEADPASDRKKTDEPEPDDEIEERRKKREEWPRRKRIRRKIKRRRRQTSLGPRTNMRASVKPSQRRVRVTGRRPRGAHHAGGDRAGSDRAPD